MKTLDSCTKCCAGYAQSSNKDTEMTKLKNFE